MDTDGSGGVCFGAHEIEALLITQEISAFICVHLWFLWGDPGESKIDVGLAARDDVRQRAPRPRGHGPAESAVAGVEEEVGKSRAPDERHVGRGRRAKPGP